MVAATVAHEKEKRQPKYIGNLLKQAKMRTVESDRIFERKLQKEREEQDKVGFWFVGTRVATSFCKLRTPLVAVYANFPFAYKRSVGGTDACTSSARFAVELCCTSCVVEGHRHASMHR